MVQYYESNVLQAHFANNTLIKVFMQDMSISSLMLLLLKEKYVKYTFICVC